MRGIQINFRKNRGRLAIEEVAKALRPGKLCYVSLESMLSEYGVISQIPMSRLTVMTTGASRVHETPYGFIEFTHTKRSVPDDTVSDVKQALSRYFDFYNRRRPHSTLDGQTPDTAYFTQPLLVAAA